jgi:hypothetical protein
MPRASLTSSLFNPYAVVIESINLKSAFLPRNVSSAAELGSRTA